MGVDAFGADGVCIFSGTAGAVLGDSVAASAAGFEVAAVTGFWLAALLSEFVPEAEAVGAGTAACFSAGGGTGTTA